MCVDCHDFMKHASTLLEKQVRVKEPRTTHVFEAGRCSCDDQWRWEERKPSHSGRGAEALPTNECSACDASVEEIGSCNCEECAPTQAGEGGTAETKAGGAFAEVDSKQLDAGPLLWAVLPGHLSIIGAGKGATSDEAPHSGTRPQVASLATQLFAGPLKASVPSPRYLARRTNLVQRRYLAQLGHLVLQQR